MSQSQVQVPISSKVSLRYFSEPIEVVRSTLLKYCYLDSKDSSNFEKPFLFKIIRTCKNETYLRFSYMFLSEFILPFFDLGRTCFNKLRASFMRQIIIGYEQDILYEPNFNEFFKMYSIWLHTSGTFSDETCKAYYNKVIWSKLLEDWESIRTRINQNKLS